MLPTSKTARIAGLWYLSMVFTAPFCLLYVPNTMLVKGDAAATAHNILTHETMLRLGIAAELITAVISIYLVMALYRLFKDVDKTQATLLVILGALVSAPISFLNVLNELAALMLVRSGEALAAFSEAQRQALALLFMRLHVQGFVVVQIFWGLWLFPFGVLVIKSRFIPRVLGIWLLVNGLTYVAVSATSLLGTPLSVLNQWAIIGELGELWIMLWLLIRGIPQAPYGAPAMAAAPQ